MNVIEQSKQKLQSTLCKALYVLHGKKKGIRKDAKAASDIYPVANGCVFTVHVAQCWRRKFVFLWRPKTIDGATKLLRKRDWDIGRKRTKTPLDSQSVLPDCGRLDEVPGKPSTPLDSVQDAGQRLPIPSVYVCG